MAIEGLMVSRSQPETQLFKPGTPDVTEAIGVTLELYKELGFAGDPDKATADLKRDLTALTELGYDGRLYVPTPIAITFGALRKVVEGMRPDGIDSAYEYKPFWKPGTEKKSVTEEELDDAPQEALARIALFSVDTETGVDPVLRHLGLPFDDYARKDWGKDSDKTQEEAIAEDISVFDAMHTDFELDVIDHRDYAVLAGMDRIRGLDSSADTYVDPKSNKFLLNCGWMRVPVLGRRKVDGGSRVGGVSSDDGQLGFDGDSGRASSGVGVGLSAGQKLKA